jgi:hypothetical protein
MTLTEDDAGKVLEAVTTLLQKQGARQILDGIDESRRLGVEEELPQHKSSELKQVARTRRRPPHNAEMIHIVLELLYQRLIVLPRIGTALKTRLGVGELFWRVDTEFVSADRLPESRLSDLLPDGVEEIMNRLTRVMELSKPSNVEHGA